MSVENQYQAPSSNVDQAVANEYGDVKIFSVSGRIGRIRYITYSIGFSILLLFVVGILSAIIIPIFGNDPGASVAAIALMYIPLYAMLIMFGIQRSHDFNTSGWLSLITFIPLAPLLFWFIPGTHGSNRFGNQPEPNSTGVWVGFIFCMLGIVMYIGVIFAVAIPAYQGYIEAAKQAQIDQMR